MMKQLVEQIRVIIGVSIEDQNDWLDISEECIERGSVERLSSKGLLQSLDRLAYESATYSYMIDDVGILPISLWDSLLTQMDDIHDTIALASGIHPDVLYEIFECRSNYYLDLYLQMADEYEY